MFQDARLAPHEALTVRVGFPAGAIPAPKPILHERWSFARAFALTPLSGGLLAALSMLALLAGWLVQRRGRDQRPSDPAGIAGLPGAIEDRPPDHLPPALADLIVHQRVRPLALTATIVDLCARGYLRIDEIKPARHQIKPRPATAAVADWRLVRLTDADERMLEYERLLFGHLFSWPPPGAHPSVPLSRLNTHLASRYHSVEQALYAEAMRRGWFTDRPDRAYRNAWWTGAAVTVVGAVLIVPAAAFSRLGLVPIPIVILGLALMIGARWMPRRTVTGGMLRNRVLAFRDYLRTTAFVDPARAASGTVARYLGYATVFELTRQWRTVLTLTTATAGSTIGVDDYPAWPLSFAAHTDDFSRTSSRALGGTQSGFGARGSSGSSRRRYRMTFFSRDAGAGGGGGGGSSDGGGGGGGGGSW